MRLEDMEHEFPKMPEEMRAMVEREVAKQVKTTSHTTYRKKKHMARRTFIAALVAAMALGTTVFAGVVYQMHSRSIGRYGVETSIEGNGNSAGVIEAGTEEMNNLSCLKLEVGYVPEGMVRVEEGKYSYEDNMYQGGISMCFYYMDKGDAQFTMQTENVLSSEDITVNGYDAVWLKLQNLYEEESSINQRLYVAYTDVHYVMEMYIGSDVTKEEALKIAESVKVTPVAEDAEGEDIIRAYAWSAYVESLQMDEALADTERYSDSSVAKEEMENTHQIGESFSLEGINGEEIESDKQGLMVKIAEVQVSDDISLLDSSVMDTDLQKEIAAELDSSGKLLPATLQYVKYGDGVNTLDEIVQTREVSQKLVYVTVEYTNTGDTELTDVLFIGNLSKIREDGAYMRMYYGEEPEDGEAWDEVYYDGVAMHQEMWYYDVYGGDRGNNYIASIQPGETVTVHMAWVVPEEELGYMYLNMDTYGGAAEFSDNSLAVGYVDIRQ